MRKALNWGNGPVAKPKGAAETVSQHTESESFPLTIHNSPGLQDDSFFISLQSYPHPLDATVVRGLPYLTLPYLYLAQHQSDIVKMPTALKL